MTKPLSDDEVIAEHASVRITQLGGRDFRIRLILDGGRAEITGPEPFATYQEALEALADRLNETMQFTYVQ
jgi:hypothetical protein